MVIGSERLVTATPPVTVAAITGDAIASNSLESLARGKSTGVLYSEKNSPKFGRVKREPGRKMRPTWPLSRVLAVLALSVVTLSVPEEQTRGGGGRGSVNQEGNISMSVACKVYAKHIRTITKIEASVDTHS